MGYDEWKTRTPWDDVKAVQECAECGGEIYKGEESYCIDNQEWVHDVCFHSYAMDKLDAVLKPAK